MEKNSSREADEGKVVKETPSKSTISLRPRAMFSMKGKGKTEGESVPFAPSWGDSSSASDNPIAISPLSKEKQWNSVDGPKKRTKVLRYTKEELLDLYSDLSTPPIIEEASLVLSPECLPPVCNEDFNYDEFYRDWAMNRGRGRGRGRGTPNSSGGRGRGASSSAPNSESDKLPWDRNRKESEENSESSKKWDRPQKRDSSSKNDSPVWERGARVPEKADEDDLWDDVTTTGGVSSESLDMGLSNMAEAASLFRMEMDKMHGKERIEKGGVATLSSKLEETTLDGQWDMPTSSSSLSISETVVEKSISVIEHSNEPSVDPVVETSKDTSIDPVSSSSTMIGDAKPAMAFETLRSESVFSSSRSLSITTNDTSTTSVLSSMHGMTPWGGVESSVHQPPLMMQQPPMLVDAWFYLDPQGNQQGPFKSAEMRDWFEAGYFKPNLPVRRGHFGNFTPLASNFRDGRPPFLDPPTALDNFGLRQQHQLLERQRMEQQRQEQLLEQQRLEQQRLEQQRLEQQRLEQQRLEQQRLERQRIEEQQRLEQQRHEQLHLETMAQQQRIVEQQQQQLRQQAFNQTNAWGNQPQPSAVQQDLIQALGMIGQGSNSSSKNTTRQDQESSTPTDSWKGITRNHQLSGESLLPDPSEQLASSKTEHIVSDKVDNKSGVRPQKVWGSPEKPAEPMSKILEEERRVAASKQTPGSAPSEGHQKIVSKPSQEGGNSSHEVGTGQSRSKSNGSSDTTGRKPTPAASTASWANPVDSSRKAKSLKEIQDEEQAQMRARLKQKQQQGLSEGPSMAERIAASSGLNHGLNPSGMKRAGTEADSSGGNLADMGAQLKMMLGVGGGGNKSSAPWTTSKSSGSRSSSLRDILAEEEASKQTSKPNESGSGGGMWSNVVSGRINAPVARKNQKLPQQVRQQSSNNSALPKSSPKKSSEEAMFWNMDDTKQRSYDKNSTTTSKDSINEFGGTTLSNDFMTWCQRQLKKLGGSDDMTLIHFCSSLEDPGEIREYIAAYLGSTPEVSAFATEFINRKKSQKDKPSATAKTVDNSDGSFVVASKKGKKKKRGQKVDASLLGYSVTSSRPNQGDIDYGA